MADFETSTFEPAYETESEPSIYSILAMVSDILNSNFNSSFAYFHHCCKEIYLQIFN